MGIISKPGMDRIGFGLEIAARVAAVFFGLSETNDGSSGASVQKCAFPLLPVLGRVCSSFHTSRPLLVTLFGMVW